MDGLENGLTPFLLGLCALHKCTEQQCEVNIASVVYAGTTATLADAVHLLADDDGRVPLD